MDREMETRHLTLADRHIAEGEARVERQQALLERLRMRGANTAAAEDFLALLELTLASWNRQRDLIVKALGPSLA